MRRVLVILATMVILGTIAGAVCWRDANAQIVQIDTATQQYRMQPALMDSLGRRTLVWARRLRLLDWRITIRGDTLENAIAQTYAHPDYRIALIVFDVRNALTWDMEETILHELLHAKVASYTATARMLVGGHDPLARELQRREEFLVTELARAFHPFTEQH